MNMRTVNEISKITGISVRALHYYDEIGLLKPTVISEARYRLYDENALEKLQQILFFREFDLPLNQIKEILDNPGFNRFELLRKQKMMLERKEERLRQMIHSIDRILEGERVMDFEMFSQKEIEELFDGMKKNLSEDQIASILSKYGSMNRYKEDFIEKAKEPEAQENFKKLVELYGGKEEVLAAGTSPDNPQRMEDYQKCTSDIFTRLSQLRQGEPSSPEVIQLMEKYEEASKTAFHLKDMKPMMMDMAKLYLENEQIKKAMDDQYGEGTCHFIGEVMMEYYKK